MLIHGNEESVLKFIFQLEKYQVVINDTEEFEKKVISLGKYYTK